MSILLDDAQEAIAREARRAIAAKADRERLLGLLTSTGEFDREFWNVARAQGWTGIGIPESEGGVGLGLLELGLISQAAGEFTAGVPFLTFNYGVSQALQAAGEKERGGRWLPALAAGDAIGCCAFAERNSPIPRRCETTFADGRISGVKRGVTAGLAADIGLVMAREESQTILALVELDAVRREPISGFDNSRLHADLDFEDAPAIVLARGAEADRIALDVLARMAVATAFEQLGGAEALLFIARDYANTRKAFGQPIGGFQSIKHRIAELYALVEIARANCLHAASREGEADFLSTAAAARLSATEAYDAAARDCIQIHGGLGVTWDLGLHLHMRRARSLAIEQGNALFWEDVLAADLIGPAENRRAQPIERP